MPKIQLLTRVRAPIERCFDLSRSIDLHVESMRGSGEAAIAGKTEGLIGLDEEVTWRARHFGVSQKLTSRVTAYDRPVYFADEMVKGAFQSFIHHHYFKSEEDETLMTDVFDFQAPWGPLGSLACKLFLTGYMERLLHERNETIRLAAEGDFWRKYL